MKEPILTARNSSEKFVELKEKDLHILKSPALAAIPWLRHGFSTRVGGQSVFPSGSLNLGFTEFDSRRAVEANRVAFFEAIGMEGFSVVRLRQSHSDRVALIASRVLSHPIIDADAAVTEVSQVVLTVVTADCLPILMVDSNSHAVGVVHAGWRGTTQGIAAKTVETLVRKGAGPASNLKAAIGPSIRACCYEVGDEVLAAFRKTVPGPDKYFSVLPPGGETTQSDRNPASGAGRREKFFLDLIAANRDQLMDAGVRGENISVSPACTGCHPELFFSHRKENGRTGRMMSAIASIG
ncbi:MAG: peptidoglycan editing factor PgeF [Acidobacteriia bacterium]|nr:peptidoglycan editing factor PgeF [Terriglobia bacterium]